MPASSSFMLLSPSLSPSTRRYAGERRPPPLVSPHGLILTLGPATPSAAARLWARRCWYHRGNRHSIRRDESILFPAKNKLLVEAYLARSSFRAVYLLSLFVSLSLASSPLPPPPSAFANYVFARST